MKTLKYLLPVFLLCNLTFAQNGYELDPESVVLPDASITLEATALPIPSLREDTKAIGMGKTQIANGKFFNAMLYNPALLSRSRFSIDAISFSIGLPPETYDAANYLKNHFEEFKDAYSLREVWSGISDFNNSQDIQQQLEAVKKIQKGIRFYKDLFDDVIGSTEDPQTHGIRTIPAFALQVGNFGFSLYGITQSAFEVEQSPIIDALLAVKIPDDMNNPDEVANAILSLQGLLQPLEQLNSFDEALPVTYSISYIDLVGAAGYAYDISPAISVGATLKVIHRRFSAKRILFDEYSNILNILKRDLNNHITGFTFDIGALYKFPTGTEVGFSLQNIIPVKKISSTLTANFAFNYLDYKRDQFGNKQLNERGDTIIQSVNQSYIVGLPFDLELPMILNIGAVHPITENWDAALDIVDLTEKDIRFENYLERIRIGSEYRLDAIKDKLGIAFRIGMADKRFTGGIGLNFYKALQVDGAYAYDNYIAANAYYVQVKIGW